MKKTPDIIKKIARDLRKNHTPSEKIIWKNLKDSKLGVKIQRQFPLYMFTEDSGLYRFIIPDFYCSEKRAIIEIDGNIHNKKEIYFLDKYKESILVKQGYSILRIKNKEIVNNLEELLNKIQTFLNSLRPLSLEKRENSKESFKKRFIMRNESFLCDNCGKEITKHPTGSARNHCPYCLHSKHLDKDFPGDRASECLGIMKPVGKDYHKNKGWMVIHECQKCGKKIPNKLSEDDSVEVYGRL